MLSIAPISSSARDSNWLERIPMLHIRHASVDEVIENNEKNTFIFQHHLDGRLWAANYPVECKLKSGAEMEKIYGVNWHGWLAEDSYEVIDRSVSTPGYCERYSRHNRCLRMVIGNLKLSATMARYCLARDPKNFDLDAGLSHDIFLKIIKTIRFADK